MSEVVRIADVLAGRHPVGSRVGVQGWVRTRRDSKAGLSFVHLHDGSGFDALQVVAGASLPNYEAEVLRLTAGCALTVERDPRAVAGPGPGRRAAGRVHRGRGLGGRPGHLPHLAEAPQLRVPARGGATCASRTNTIGAVARVRHCLAHGHPPLLRRARLRLDPHAHHHGQRCRGRRRALPRLHAGPRQPAARARTGRSTSGRTSSASRPS